MKVIHKYILLVTFLVTFAGRPGKSQLNNPPDDGFAVLELFTSEGCSSCPPADELMASIQKETKGEAVFIIAYHVDYWDRLGWKDVFSSPAYSDRQQQYGRWLNVSPIYTPQVVVNGKEQFVGSESSAIHKAITEQLKVKPGTTLTLQAIQGNGKLNLKYQATSIKSGCRLMIALLQKSAQSHVGRGENQGRLLSHIQIVRKLQSEVLSGGSGNSTIELPKDFNTQTWEVLAFIQDQHNGAILSIAKVELH
jgi:hypothetical protein